MAMPVICQSCHSPHGLSLHWPLPPKFIICLAAREFSKLQSAPDTAKTHRWLPTACRIPKGLSLAFQASHHLNLAVAGSPSSFLPLSSTLTLTTWALGTFYLCALADAVPLAWNSLRLQGSAPMWLLCRGSGGGPGQTPFWVYLGSGVKVRSLGWAVLGT